ncbi:MAG: DUF1254 domain-containing protein [Pseudomonadota bacterium]
MKGVAGVVLLVSAGLAHWATLELIPGAIMSRAMDMMAERGIPLHSFVLVPRATPQNQTVVRPSPDLAYSICRFDLDQVSLWLDVEVAPYPGMSSVSFFDDQTNNFSVVAIPIGEAMSFRLVSQRDMEGSGLAESTGSILAPSQKGLILIRRLAPNDEYSYQVNALAVGDRCAPPSPANVFEVAPEG